ncbi:alpha/beta hydrolase [Neobacillus notoginsengisoli]|uniref:Alpha/beta hydrolase n=1 Tax=Neobacillus notoginsengisoli TaxID=1578198 RepID=A0A417YS03_9BACI|nr:alpha/beta hydrolase [Neobacillus notoginsengisoli]RHW38078.1 alpha/beta hydrolase [Neobacillus notoginsengisoli]
MKKTIVYKQAGSHEIKADFYGVEARNAPVLMYIHGGGLIFGSRDDMKEEQIKLYNEAGFAVFSIDYRLAPETKIADIKLDVEDAFLWLKTKGSELFQIDPERIFISGGSAGGYLSLLSGTFETKPKGIISFYGYGDIIDRWATESSAYFRAMSSVPKELVDMLIKKEPLSEGPINQRFGIYLYGRQTGSWIEDMTGYDPILQRDLVKKWSPYWNVSADFPPTLLLHGTKDDDVPYEESVKMAKALTEAGVPNKLITIPGGVHVFDENMDDPAVKDAFNEVISFLHSLS